MSSFPNNRYIIADILDRQALDVLFLNALRPVLIEFGLLADEYVVRCTGSRDVRWREQDRVLTWGEIEEDLKNNDGDGLSWSRADGQRLPSLGQRYGNFQLRSSSLSGRDIGELYPSLSLKYLNAICSISPLTFAIEQDDDYAAWMRCSDQDFYNERHGQSEGLPLVPDPKKAKKDLWIDRSLFPGRFERVAQGFVSVASHMWLGPEFWKIAACTPEQVKSQDWLKWEEWPHGVLYIYCWPVPFNRPNGEQGQLQKKLWRLLFDKDCHWPLPDGVGGPQAQPAVAATPTEPPAPTVCPYEPPQVATAVFDATQADVAKILLSMHVVMDGAAGAHRGYYSVLPTGLVKIWPKSHLHRLTIDEALTELNKYPNEALVMLVSTQSFAIGICPTGVQPGKVLARIIGPVGNPNWIPYLGSYWAAELVRLPGFELLWMGNVDAELGIPTPPEAEKGDEGEHDHDYVIRAMQSPDRWAGRPIGSTMWFPSSRRKDLEASPFRLTEKKDLIEFTAWPEPLSATPPSAEETAVRQKLQTLVHG